jgi:hypothetical protein
MANIRVTRCSYKVVRYVAFDVRAEVDPGLGGMVYLIVTLGEVGIRREDGCSEGEHDGAFECRVGGSVVHDLVVRVEQVPCFLSVGLVVAVSDELS